MLKSYDEQGTLWDKVLETKTAQHVPELHLHLGSGGAESIWNWTISPVLIDTQT